jgi:predicted nucleotidyltransferase
VRLSAFEEQSIRYLSKQVFGDAARVYLFGSRTDDTKRGGDIDLLIIPSGNFSLQEIIEMEIRFLAGLKIKIGDQKIDVLVKTSADADKQIFQSAEQQGIPLC